MSRTVLTGTSDEEAMEQTSSQSPLFQRTSDVLKRYQKSSHNNDDIENQSPISMHANVATKLVLSTPSPGEGLNNSIHIDINSTSKKNILKNYMNNQLELNEQESQYYEEMIYKLAEEMEDVKTERDDLLLSKKALSSSVEASEVRLAQSEENLRRIQSENSKMKSESDDLKKQILQLKNAESSQLKDIDRLKSLVDNGKVASDDLRKQVTALSAEAQCSKGTIADLRAQLESTIQTIRALEDDLKIGSSLSKSNEENSSSVLKVYMDNQLDLQKADFQYYEDAISELAMKLEEITSDRDELKLSNDDLNKQLADQLDEADRKLLDYETLINSKDDELALAEHALRDIQTKFEAAKKQMEAQIQSSRVASMASKASSPAPSLPLSSPDTLTTHLPLKVEVISNEDDATKIAELETTLSTKDKEIRSQVLQLQSLQDALQEFKTDNNLLKEHRRGLKEMVQSLKNKLEDATNELSVARSNSGHSEEDKTDFKSHINVLENEIQTQKNKLESYQTELETMTRQQQLEIESFDEYKARFESFPIKLQQAEASKGVLLEENAELQKQVVYSNSKVESLSDRVRALHDKNTSLESEILTERDISANLSNLLQQVSEQETQKSKLATPLASNTANASDMEHLLFGSPAAISPFNGTPTKKGFSSSSKSSVSPKKATLLKPTTPVKAPQTPQATKTISTLRAEVDRLTALSDHLRSVNSSLTNDLKGEHEKALRLTAVEGELRTLRDHEALLRDKIYQAEEKCTEKDAEIVALYRKIQEIQNDSSAAYNRQISDLQAQLSYVQETYRNLLHDYEVFRNASIENSLNEQNDRVTLEDRIRRLEDDISSKKEMLKDNEEVIHALKISSTERGRDSRLLQDEIDFLQQELDMKAAKWSQLEINLNLELEEEKSNVRVLEGVRGNLRSHISRLEADNMSIADALTSNFSSSAEINNELRDSRAKIESLRSEVAELEIINEDIACKLLEKQREVNTAKEEFLEFKNNGYKDTLMSLTDTEATLRDVRMEMELLRIEFDGVKNERKSVEESLLYSNENASKLRNEITKTNGRCDAVLKENRKLRDQMDSMQTTNSESTREAEDSKCTLDAYKEHLMTMAVDMKVVSDSLKVKSVIKRTAPRDTTPRKEVGSSGLFNSPTPSTLDEEFEKLLQSLDRKTNADTPSLDMKAITLVNECYSTVRANAEIMLEEHDFLASHYAESQSTTSGLRELISDYEAKVLKLTFEIDQLQSQHGDLQKLMIATSAPAPAVAGPVVATPAVASSTSASEASLAELRSVYENKVALKEYEITSLQAQLSDLQSQFNQVRNLLSNETSEKKEMQKTANTLHGQLEQMQIEVKSLKNTYNYTIIDPDSSAASDATLEAEKLLAALNVTLENFKFTSKASNVAGAGPNPTLSGRTDEAISRLGELRSAYRSESAAKRALEDKVNALKEDVSRLQNVALQAQKDLMSRNRNMSSQKQTQQMPVISFAQDTNSNSTSSNSLFNEKLKLISSLENIITQKDSELGDLRVRFSMCEVEISDLKRQLQQSQVFAESASNDRSECNRKAAELLQVQNSLNKLRSEFEEVEGSLKTTRDQYLRLTESKISMEESQQMLLRKVYHMEQKAEQESRVRCELGEELDGMRIAAARQHSMHHFGSGGNNALVVQQLQQVVESERSAYSEETAQLRSQLQSLKAAYDKKESQLQEVASTYRARVDSSTHLHHHSHKSSSSSTAAIDIPIDTKDRILEMVGVIREVVNVVRVEAITFGQEINTPDAKAVRKREARMNRLASSRDADKMGLCELNAALDALKEVVSWVRECGDFRSEYESRIQALTVDNRKLEEVLADSLSQKYHSAAAAAGGRVESRNARKALMTLSDAVSNQKRKGGGDLDRSVSFEDPSSGKHAQKHNEFKENSGSTVSYALKSVTGGSSIGGFLRVSSNRK